MLTRGCGLTYVVVCSNDKIRDIRERYVEIRSKIWTINICSLGSRDIRECVTLWGLILRSLGLYHDECYNMNVLNTIVFLQEIL